jgi:integrase
MEVLVELTNLFFSEKLLDAEQKQKQNGKHDTSHSRFDVGARLQSTLHHFLIGCYTGLRRSDVTRLNKLQQVKGDFLVIQVKKGRSGKRATVRIPIKTVVRQLLDYVSPRLESHAEKGAFKDSGRIFYLGMIAATSQNEYMREIVSGYTGITKDYFNFHTSRHTFGVVSLILGLKLEVVKDMLGHAEIETTMRYAKVVDRLREMDMCKWDSLVGIGAGPVGGTDALVKIECPKCGSVGGSYQAGLFDMPRLAVVCRVCGSGFGHEVATK